MMPSFHTCSQICVVTISLCKSWCDSGNYKTREAWLATKMLPAEHVKFANIKHPQLVIDVAGRTTKRVPWIELLPEYAALVWDTFKFIMTSGPAYLLSKLSGWCQDQSLSLFLLNLQLLQDGNGKCGCFTSPWLGLSNNIVTYEAIKVLKLINWCVIALQQTCRSNNITLFRPFMQGIIALCWIAEGFSKP